MSESKSMGASSADIFSMKLHEEIEMREGLLVIKVPGGWIYRFSGHAVSYAVFVPRGI